MAALNAFYYRTYKCLEDINNTNREIKMIKKIAWNNNYNSNIINTIMEKINTKERAEVIEKISDMGSLKYKSRKTKKFVEYFRKYGIEVTITKCNTLFDKIKNNNTENISMLQRSGVYKIKCNDCSNVYLGEIGRKFEYILTDHKRGEGNIITNSLYAGHFMEENQKFVNQLEVYEIIKVEYNTVEKKLKEELEILKERKKVIDNLINVKVRFDNADIFYHILEKIEK